MWLKRNLGEVNWKQYWPAVSIVVAHILQVTMIKLLSFIVYYIVSMFHI